MARNKLEIVVTVLDQAGRPLQKISAELGQFERAAEKADKRSRGFGAALGGLNKLLGPLAAGLGAYGLSRAAYSWATEASKAEIATRLFRKQLERMGQDADAGMVKLEAVAERLGVLPQDLAEYSTQLLRQGLTMDEIATLFEGAAASALAAGKSTKEGIDAVTNAVVTQQSIYLNYAGIAENLNQAYKEMAKTLGKSVEALTKEEKARAAVNLVMQATKEEVRDLDQLLGGLPGKQNALNKEWAEFRQELGERLIPAVSELIEVATAGLRALNSLFDWLDHVFGDKVKLAFEDAKEQAGEFRRELAKSKTYDEFIERLDKISDGLTGEYKEAWDAYIKKLKETKGAVEDLSKAEVEAAKKRLELQLAQAKADAAQSRSGYKALFSSGLSAKAFAHFPDAVRSQLLAAQDKGPKELLETIVRLQDEYKKLDDGTYEHLERFRALAEQWAVADAKVKALQKSLEQLDKTLSASPAAGGTGSGSSAGATGGLKDDLRDAAESAKTLLDYVKEATDTFYGRQGNRPLTAIVNAPGHDDIAGGRMLEPKLWDFDLDERSFAPALPGWDWDLAGREAAANFAEGYADYLRDKGYHKLLAEGEEMVRGFAAELEEGTNEAFLRSLVSSRNDVGIANAARDVGEYLNQKIYDAMVRGSQDHGIQAAIKQQLEDSMKERDPMDALKSGSMDHGISAAIKSQERAAEEAKRAFEEAVAASEELLDNVSNALEGLEKMGDALTEGDVGSWFDGLSDILAEIPGVGGLLSESAQLFGRVASWFQWLDPVSSLRSQYEAQQQYDALGDRFSLIDQSAFASIEKYQEKAFFGLFSVDRYRTEIDEFALGIAQTLEQGVMGGLRSGMKAFLEGDPEWRDALHDGIRSAIESAIIDAVIQGAIFEGAMGDLLTQLTKQLAAGDEAGALATIEQINAAMPEVEHLIEDTLGAYRDALGLDDSSSSVDSAAKSTALRYELPEVSVMTSPTWTKTLEQAADTMFSAAEMFRNTVEGLNAKSTPFGALAWQLRNAGTA